MSSKRTARPSRTRRTNNASPPECISLFCSVSDDNAGEQKTSFVIAAVVFALMLYTLINWQTKVVTSSSPSWTTYQQLQKKHPNTLNCLCSSMNILYQHFLLVETSLHQICHSDFLSERWISALHRPDAGIHGALDFRATASSQVKKSVDLRPSPLLSF